MAREPQEVLKVQLGALMLEVAVLTSSLEKAQEHVQLLEQNVAKLQVTAQESK